jgi:hypothetical protein
MAYTTIDDPSAHFQVKLWTGNATAGNTITLDGNSDMQPDWMWHKEPTDTNGWHQMDSSRGPTYVLATQSTTAEYDVLSSYISSFNSNGFTAGYGDSSINSAGVSQCSWMWHCNSGTTSTDTTSSITSTVQVNSDAGFSVVTYTGDGTTTGGFGHGLGVAPKVVFVKKRNGAADWCVYHKDMGAAYFMKLNTNDAKASGVWQSLDPSSTTVVVYNGGLVNGNGDTYVAYCFAEKQGYSKFGEYVGNGNANGPFVYTGFKPAFLMVKRVDSISSWQIKDSARNPNNLADKTVFANLGNAEYSTFYFYDLLSNGFKVRGTDAELNDSGGTYIYMAFAENPFVTSTGVPTTAR